MSNYRKSGLLTFFVLLLIALVIVAIVFGIAYAVNNCRFGHNYNDDGVCTRCGVEKQKTPVPGENPGQSPDDDKFGVVVDGVKYTEDTDVSILGKTLTVKGVEKYTLRIEDRHPTNMAVIYRVPGGTDGLGNDPELYVLSNIEDWTSGFNIVKRNSSFTVENTSLLQVLIKIHNNPDIQLSGDIFSVPSSDYGKFALVITSGNNEITLNFSIPIEG